MTVRSEDAKAELKEAEQKLKEAKEELKEAEQKLKEAKEELKEAKEELKEAEQKLMEIKQADPGNTAEIQRLEQKLQGLDDAVKELGLSVISKSTIVRRLESQLLPAMAGPAFASSGGGARGQSSLSPHRTLSRLVIRRHAYRRRHQLA
jgi:chromosome segregation ATPase